MTKLGDPINIANLDVKNRFVMAPTVTNFATNDGMVTDRQLKYYEQRSKGGVGTIIVESAPIMWEYRLSNNNIGIYSDNHIPGLTKLAKRIKAQDTKAILQLVHCGHKSLVAKRLMGPSPVRIMDSPPPIELDVEEIELIVTQFVNAALRAHTAGFDGIELHGAHLYLLSAFMSSYSNHRTDQYGGSIENKTKLTIDIIYAIRKELKTFPLFCRFDSIQNIVNGINIDEAIQIAKILENAGVDVLHASGVGKPYYKSKEFALYTEETKPDFLKGYSSWSFIPCAEIIKNHVNIPVIGVGGVRDTKFAEKVMKNDMCDLLAIGQGLIADPNFVKKSLTGKGDTINCCIDCGICLKSIWSLKPLECAVNSDL